MRDALLLALQVGLDGALAWAFVAALVRGRPLRAPGALFAPAMAIGLAAGAALLAWQSRQGVAAGDVVAGVQRVRHLHALLLLALALLARGRSLEALAAGRARHLAWPASLAVAAGLLFPEGAALVVQLVDLAVLRGAAGPILAGAALGLAAAALAGALLAFLFGRARAAFTPAGVLALLFALEMAGLGARAVGAHALPTAATEGISRAVHDAVHLVFVVLQVPDHAFLEDRTYQLILAVLEPAVHATLAILVLGAPLAAAWRAFTRRPAPPPPEGARAPQRRVARAAFARDTLAGALPFVLALGIVSSALWAARGGADEMYEPTPEPVVDDGAGTVVVPLAPKMGESGDRMRKWVYRADGRGVTFFTIRRHDGALVAVLDLCEICQPRGYAQMGADHVFCKYCKTPIPLATVGQPGGCNPIPIPGAVVKGAAMLVPRDALVRAWEKGMLDKR